MERKSYMKAYIEMKRNYLDGKFSVNFNIHKER